MRRTTLPWSFPLAVALAAACSSSTSGFSTTAGDGGVDNGSDATSGGNSATASDAGTRCGAQACSASEVCCYGMGMMGTMGMPTCVASGSCQGLFLSCSSQGDCSGGQMCCFSYGSPGGADAGGPPAGRGGGAFGAPGGSFTAQCQDTCDMTSYRLCASDAECQTGETCGMGPYASYCQMARMNPFGDGGRPMNPFGDGGGFQVPPPNNASDQ